MSPIQHFPPPPGIKAPPLSFAARVGDLLFISGIPGFDGNRALPDSFEAQFANVIINIKRVLDEANLLAYGPYVTVVSLAIACSLLWWLYRQPDVEVERAQR